MGKSCERQCFVDRHLLDRVQEFFEVDAQALSFLRVCLRSGLPNSLPLGTFLRREITNVKQSDRLCNMCCEFMVLHLCAVLRIS